MHTVKEVARIAGVSVRTLHHYDDIGLLKPATIGENRYRYYGEKELLRLQQILFYREFGVSLAEIATLLDDPGFDHVAALRAHRQKLAAEAERYRQLIGTIDRTIDRMTRGHTMDNSELYKGFSPEKQAAYEDWLVENHGPEMKQHITTSKAHVSQQSPEQLEAKMEELARIEGALVKQFEAGVTADAPELDDLLDSHRAWVASMWGAPCPPEAYGGLADIYESHPDFNKRHETLSQGFTTYLTSAMRAYSKR